MPQSQTVTGPNDRSLRVSSFTSARPPAAAVFRPIAHLARLGTARSDWSISMRDRLDSAIGCETSSMQWDLRALRCQQQPRTGATFDSLRAAIRRPVRSLNMSTLCYHGGRKPPTRPDIGPLASTCFWAQVALCGTFASMHTRSSWDSPKRLGQATYLTAPGSDIDREVPYAGGTCVPSAANTSPPSE